MPDGGTSLLVSDLYYFYPEGSDAVSIGQGSDGTPTWARPSTDLFGPAISQPSYFSFSEPLDLDFTVMTVTGRGTGLGTEGVLDLSKDLATTAFTVNTGDTKWAVPGSSFGCGRDPFLYWQREKSKDPASYLCRYSGSAARDPAANDSQHFLTKDLVVTLDKIDPQTGAASWSRPMGDAKRLVGDFSGAESALLDDTHLFVPNSAGGLVIDLDSGETRAPVQQDTFWCGIEDSFPRPEPFFTASTPVSTADRAGLVNPCHADGTPATVPTTTIPTDIGSTFDGDLRVVALAHEVAGFLTPPATSAADSTANASESASAEPTDSASPIGTADPTTTALSPSLTAVEQAWAATAFEPRTTPKIIGGTAVIYGTVGTGLFLIGLDPATGAERWRRPASAASLNPDTEIDVDEIDGLVAYFRPDNPNLPVLSSIVLIDPATGTDMIAAELRGWYTFPEICPDDPASLCAWAHNVELDNTVQNRRFRINRQDAAVTLIPEGTAADPVPFSTLWNDLVSMHGTPDESVGIVRDGAVRWSKPVAELLGAGGTLDHGWYASQDNGAAPVLELSGRIGWAGTPGTDGKSHPSLDLANNLITVGINRNDGSVLWRQIGTSPQCRYALPSRSLMSTPGSPNPAIRCRYTGRLDSSPPGRSYGLTVPTDLTVTVERVDLQTGEAIWSVPVGVAAPLAVAPHGVTTTFLDDHRLLVNNTLIDMDTGDTRAPTPGETFWCPAQQSFNQSEQWFGNDGSGRVDRAARGEMFTCDGNAKPTTAIPAAVPLAISAVSEDGLRLVSTPGGVVAYRVPR